MTDLDDISSAPSGSTRKFYFAVAILTGALRLLTIPLVGAMPVSEIILLVLLSHAIMWLVLHHQMPARFPRPRFLSMLIICQLVALAGYVISDFWRGSSQVDMIRGWLRMIFLMIDMGALALLFGADSRNFILVQAGTCLTGFQFLFMRPIFGDYWKFAFATPITVLLLLLAPRWLGFWASVAACAGLGLLHIILDFRSMAAMCFLVGVMQTAFILPTAIRKMILITFCFLTVAASPWIARRAFAETEGRANRSNVERSSMIQAAWEAFSDSPLIGHGSWFSNSNVMDNFLMIRKQRSMIGGGGGMGFDHREFEGLTIHSQILTALAEGGILGGVFFMSFGALILWSLYYCLMVTPWTWVTPIRLFVLTSSLFDVLMAPFSGTRRLDISIAATLTLVLLQEALGKKQSHFSGIDNSPLQRGHFPAPILSGQFQRPLSE